MPDGLSATSVCDFGGRNTPDLTTVEWYTPEHIFDALGLGYDLDPAAPKGGVPWIPATRHYSVEDGGLTQPWEGRVWLNPPYGRETQKWVDRLIEHGNGVALVFARVDAAWAQRAIQAADGVCFISGRLSFLPGNGPIAKGHNAAAPSMLLGYGAICGAAVMRCGLGTPMRLVKDESTLLERPEVSE